MYKQNNDLFNESKQSLIVDSSPQYKALYKVSDSNFATALHHPVHLTVTPQWKYAPVTFIYYAIIEAKQTHFLVLR